MGSLEATIHIVVSEAELEVSLKMDGREEEWFGHSQSYVREVPHHLGDLKHFVESSLDNLLSDESLWADMGWSEMPQSSGVRVQPYSEVVSSCPCCGAPIYGQMTLRSRYEVPTPLKYMCDCRVPKTP